MRIFKQSSKRRNFSLCGFTLAEVLVTLGIIGVVSAMTLPTLMKNHQRQVAVVSLRNFYSMLSQAIVDYQNSRNAVNIEEAGLGTADGIRSLINEKFKITQSCVNSLTPCMASEYKTINNGNVSISNGSSYVLANGMSLRIIISREPANKIANIMIDTNGKQGPNRLGRDLFFIALYSNGKMDDYISNGTAPLTIEQRESVYNSACMSSGTSSGWGCFGKLLNDNWQMNY